MKTYRKKCKATKRKCDYCHKPFMGKGRAKYCKPSHRTMANKKRNSFNSVAALKELLLLELEYFKGDSVLEYVELCGYIWRRYVKTL